jgi:hypothetical protein
LVHNQLSKKVFISYARAANKGRFVQRLDKALSPIAKVFWDRKLGIGDWEQQLIQQIKNCEVMVVVMSKAQQQSENCQLEIDTALAEGKEIIPLRYIKGEEDTELGRYQWADFSDKFDMGFSQLTFLIYNQNIYPWEIYYRLDNEKLFAALENGFLPTFIATEIATWVLTHKFWTCFVSEIMSSKTPIDAHYNPQTLLDFLTAVKIVEKRISEGIDRTRDFASLSYAHEAVKQIGPLVVSLSGIGNDENIKAGQCAIETMRSVAKYIERTYTLKRNFGKVADFRKSGQYSFDIASKMRELIQQHAQRLKNL